MKLTSSDIIYVYPLNRRSVEKYYADIQYLHRRYPLTFSFALDFAQKRESVLAQKQVSCVQEFLDAMGETQCESVEHMEPSFAVVLFACARGKGLYANLRSLDETILILRQNGNFGQNEQRKAYAELGRGKGH